MENNLLGIVVVNDGFQPLHGVQPDLFGELNGFVSEEYCVFHFIHSYVTYFSENRSLNGFLVKFFRPSMVDSVLYCLKLQCNVDSFSHIDVYRPILMFNIASVIAKCNNGVALDARIFDIAYSMYCSKYASFSMS